MNWPSPPASQTGQLKFPWKYVTLLYCYFRSVQWPMEISAPVSSQIHSYQLGHWPLQWPTCPVCPRVNKRKKKKILRLLLILCCAPQKKISLEFWRQINPRSRMKWNMLWRWKNTIFFLLLFLRPFTPQKALNFNDMVGEIGRYNTVNVLTTKKI